MIPSISEARVLLENSRREKYDSKMRLDYSKMVHKFQKNSQTCTSLQFRGSGFDSRKKKKYKKGFGLKWSSSCRKTLRPGQACNLEVQIPFSEEKRNFLHTEALARGKNSYQVRE